MKIYRLKRLKRALAPLYTLTFYGGTTIVSNIAIKPICWVGSAKKDLRAFPAEVQDVVGFALYMAQGGQMHPDAKVLKGFGSAGVLEVVEDFRGDTFRAVYTVRFTSAVYVLHAFQKKSKSGIKTPAEDIDLIRRRLKDAEADHKHRLLLYKEAGKT